MERCEPILAWIADAAACIPYKDVTYARAA